MKEYKGVILNDLEGIGTKQFRDLVELLIDEGKGFVVEDSGVVKGFYVWEELGKNHHIVSVYVVPVYRNKVVIKAIYSEMLKLSGDKKVTVRLADGVEHGKCVINGTVIDKNLVKRKIGWVEELKQ